ncbi:PPK2 family polyphosphate kinase [Imtechella halotolerans]|uniref:Polyphosphate kinase-2-related domain-containing protein n=1 Tax=Imtechella halotolerans K1 TaxID=946077 RepID=I0WGL2_9FLAO|nr:PPK2 family polyphosphate kinase [Imtechella halotolerans]EID75528.1 hypothetical protein W5A_04918 [Imtechella halotolerans K1]WMQ63643.1 polyphosphate kinase 2 family protein [Imtechella halotolerans]
MKTISVEKYKVTGPVKLASIPTLEDFNSDEKELKEALKKVRKKLAKFQDTMYAHARYGVLVCFQGMDTAGKDSLIRELFKDFNSRGVVVHSFKTPTDKELRHDYLWRHYIALPERGKFSVFNRTHYENVLVTRVHPQYILNENIPGVTSVDDIDDVFWQNRFDQINNFEKHISENGVLVFKFYLHLSKEEQRKRLLRRLEEEEHNWKFSPGDLKERNLWDTYQSCYEEAISQTSKEKAPWFVVPADNKEAARYIIASVLWSHLSAYTDVREPELDSETLKNLHIYKEQLEAEHE